MSSDGVGHAQGEIGQAHGGVEQAQGEIRQAHGRLERRGECARRAGPLALGVLALALLAGAPAAQAAPGRPAVSTGEAKDRTWQGATVVGSVNPHGRETTAFFQYGTDRLYGATTPETPVGKARRRIAVSAALAGLAPSTRYHYRLVARNRRGLTIGPDRVLRTRRQPLGLALTAQPNPVRPGRPTVLTGNLTGTGSAGRQVVLQANPYPHQQGFATVGNPQVTDAQGSFAFPLLSVPVNTQYRVLMPARPEVVSPIVWLGVSVRVSTRVRARAVRPGGRRPVRFTGTIRPAVPGSRVAIQRLRRTGWQTVATTTARGGGKRFSRYGKTLRLRRGGRFRVLADLAGAPYVADGGRSRRIRVR